MENEGFARTLIVIPFFTTPLSIVPWTTKRRRLGISNEPVALNVAGIFFWLTFQSAARAGGLSSLRGLVGLFSNRFVQHMRRRKFNWGFF